MFSNILEGIRELVANGVSDCTRDANACRVGQRRNTHGYVAAVTVDPGARFDEGREGVNWHRSDSAAYQIVAVCHRLTDMDADAERNAPVWCCADIAVDDTPLRLDGTLHRLDRAGELDQQTAAGCLYDATVMLRNLWTYELTPMSLQAFERAFLVRSDQARVAHHVSGERHDKTKFGELPRAPSGRAADVGRGEDERTGDNVSCDRRTAQGHQSDRCLKRSPPEPEVKKVAASKPARAKADRPASSLDRVKATVVRRHIADGRHVRGNSHRHWDRRRRRICAAKAKGLS